MKCEHCEAACATLECLECTVKGQEAPVQLCDDCSMVIHKGRMSNHTVTPRDITPRELSMIKKAELRKKLDAAYGLRAGLESRISDIGFAQKDLQNRIRGYERELRTTVTAVQNKVKERCRNLYTAVKEDVNNTCIELTDKEAILKQRLSTIRQIGDEVERAIHDLDDDEFLESTKELEEKIVAAQEVSPIELPDMDAELQIDLADIEGAIQAIDMKRIETDKSFDIPAIPQEEGIELKVYVPGRMTRDSTFCVQPELPAEVYTALDRMNTAIRTHFIQQFDWQTFADSGTTPAVGEQVFVLFASENKWYRARIEEVRPDKTCGVIYTDFGNIEHVNLKSVLPKRRGLFPDVPAQTLECSLFATLRSDLSNAARWAFSDLVNDAQCTCHLKSKVEGISRDVWQVELTVEAEDGSITNIADVVQASIDEAEIGCSAIKCRDVRLLDNPEVYSKLRTVTIERPSNKNKGQDNSRNETVMVIPPVNGINDSSLAAADSPRHEDEVEEEVPQHCTDDIQDGAVQEQDAAEEEDQMPAAVNDDMPMEVVAPDNATGTKARAGSDGEDCETVALRGVADSPSCDDYQSAASSLDDHSGSITPVSASSHLSNTASPAIEPATLTEEPADPVAVLVDVPAGAEERHMEVEEKPRPDKKKKKKKRTPRKESEDDKIGPASLLEKTPPTKPEPVPIGISEEAQKPFVITDWLNQMGNETPAHQVLCNNIQGVAKLLTSSEKLEAGELILALDDHNLWQRAAVTGFKGRKVDVHFLDSMKEKSVHPETGVRTILSKLRSLPPAIILPENVQELVATHYMEAGEQFIPMPSVCVAVATQQDVHPASETNDIQQDEQEMPYQCEDGMDQQYTPLMEGHGNEMLNHMDQCPPQNFQQEQSNWGNQSRGPPEGRRRRYDNQESWDTMDQRSDRSDRSDHRGQRGDRSDRGDRRDRRDGGRGDRRDQGSRGGDRRGERQITCFTCGEQGHISTECGQPLKLQQDSSLVCYNCNNEGHFSRECPYKQPSANSHPHQRDRRDNDRRRDNRRQGGGGGKSRSHRHPDDRGSWRGDRNERPSDNRPSGGGGGGGSSRQSYSSEVRSTEPW